MFLREDYIGTSNVSRKQTEADLGIRMEWEMVFSVIQWVFFKIHSIHIHTLYLGELHIDNFNNLYSHQFIIPPVAWIGSICSGLNFFMAPLASVLVDKLGVRPTSVIGSTLALIGVFTSSFVTRIEFMYVTYGVLVGVGFGLCYQPSLVILGVYFKKRLGLVNGLAAFGSSVFTICLPFIMRTILDVGLAPCLWFQASLIFVMLILAFTFRPLPQETQSPRTTVSPQGEYSCVDRNTENTDNKDCGEMDNKKYDEVSNSCSDVQQNTEDGTRTRCRISCGKMIDFSIWRERNYRIWTIGLVTGCFGYFVPFFHLVRLPKFSSLRQLPNVCEDADESWSIIFKTEIVENTFSNQGVKGKMDTLPSKLRFCP